MSEDDPAAGLTAARAGWFDNTDAQKDSATGRAARQPAGAPVSVTNLWLQAFGRQRQQSPPRGISLDDFHAYMPGAFVHLRADPRDGPAASINARILRVVIVDAGGHPVIAQKGKQRILPANLWLDQNKPVEQMTWAPGLPMFIRNRLISDGGWIKRSGVTCFNLYRPPINDPGDPASAGPWLSHVHKVFPDDADHIVKWIA